MTERRRVVVTGVGAVTPLGLDATETFAQAIAGHNAISTIRAFDASQFPVRIAAEVPATQLAPHFRQPKLRKYADRKIAMAVMAAEEAMTQAGFPDGAVMPVSARFGVAVGSEAGRPPIGDIAARLYELHDVGDDAQQIRELLGALDPLDFVRTAPHLPATLLSALMGAQGPVITCSTACTSSAQALGEAALTIRRGTADVMLAGGCDALVEAFMVAGFALLGALSTRNDEPERASRPFDRKRDGFVLGEGAGFVVLESAEHARRRGATILAELSGYGCSSNAYRITDSPPDGRGAYQSMRDALRDAEVEPGEIDYINAHGTSTAMNDSSETLGIRRALGDAADSCPVSSTKSMMGHLVAACGAVEAILCIQTIASGVVPPTINYEEPDPACDLDYVPGAARKVSVRRAMTNSFGFGGSNGTLIFSADGAQ